VDAGGSITTNSRVDCMCVKCTEESIIANQYYELKSLTNRD